MERNTPPTHPHHIQWVPVQFENSLLMKEAWLVWFELTATQISTLYNSSEQERTSMYNILNLEEHELLQQKTSCVSNIVWQEQDFGDSVGTDSAELECWILDKNINMCLQLPSVFFFLCVCVIPYKLDTLLFMKYSNQSVPLTTLPHYNVDMTCIIWLFASYCSRFGHLHEGAEGVCIKMASDCMSPK